MSDADKVKSQAMIDTSDSDTDVSDSEFRNVAKKPRLEDQGNVSLPQLYQTPYYINYLQKSSSGSPRKSSSSSSSSSSGSGDEWEGNEKEAEKKK